MTNKQLEKKIAALEQELKDLKLQLSIVAMRPVCIQVAPPADAYTRPYQPRHPYIAPMTEPYTMT